jgi:anti-anti-sigma factor
VGVVIERTALRGYRLTGELDASNVADVDEVIEADLLSGGDLTLDLSELTFVDSLGVSLFFAAARKLEGRGDLVLLSPDHSVHRVLELVQLEQLLNVRILTGRADASGQPGE